MKKVKVGQLPLKVGVLPSTIRYYEKEGFIKPVGQTQGGYHLFDEEKALSVIQKVKQLQEKERLPLFEIKSRLKAERDSRR